MEGGLTRRGGGVVESEERDGKKSSWSISRCREDPRGRCAEQERNRRWVWSQWSSGTWQMLGSCVASVSKKPGVSLGVTRTRETLAVPLESRTGKGF